MGTKRRLKRLAQRIDHSAALQEVGLWEDGLQRHFHVTVARLMMARTPRKKAEAMAYHMIVKGLQGMSDRELEAEAKEMVKD